MLQDTAAKGGSTKGECGLRVRWNLNSSNDLTKADGSELNLFGSLSRTPNCISAVANCWSLVRYPTEATSNLHAISKSGSRVLKMIEHQSYRQGKKVLQDCYLEDRGQHWEEKWSILITRVWIVSLSICCIHAIKTKDPWVQNKNIFKGYFGEITISSRLIIEEGNLLGSTTRRSKVVGYFSFIWMIILSKKTARYYTIR